MNRKKLFYWWVYIAKEKPKNFFTFLQKNCCILKNFVIECKQLIPGVVYPFAVFSLFKGEKMKTEQVKYIYFRRKRDA